MCKLAADAYFLSAAGAGFVSRKCGGSRKPQGGDGQRVQSCQCSRKTSTACHFPANRAAQPGFRFAGCCLRCHLSAPRSRGPGEWFCFHFVRFISKYLKMHTLKSEPGGLENHIRRHRQFIHPVMAVAARPRLKENRGPGVWQSSTTVHLQCGKCEIMPSVTTPAGGQDGNFRRARPAIRIDFPQGREAEKPGVDRHKVDFLE